MRLGFILGFLFGGGAASLLASAGREARERADDAASSAGKPMAQLKRRVREARREGEEASKQKQAEMLADYEAAKRHH